LTEITKMPNEQDLEALFDEVSAATQAAACTKPAAKSPSKPEAAAPVAEAAPAQPRAHDGAKLPALDADFANHDVFVRVGELTRRLHDSLRELGYHQDIEQAVGSLPDARARLSYIADLTGKAADKVLGMVDDGMAAEHAMSERAAAMAGKLATIQAPSLRVEAFEFAEAVKAHADAGVSRYTDIMMSQDFHDLTGQVVKKIADVAQNLEQQLVRLLLDITPANQRAHVLPEQLEGPVVDKARTDVVHDQSQVDDLLESLGF
jgi:chemotaxis protein CheZ